MKSKTLALIFLACIVAGFFMAAIGDNSGNTGLFIFGAVVVGAGIVAFVKWWKNQDSV
jgi:hypothetical protein